MKDLKVVVAELIRFDLRRYVIGGVLWLPVRAFPLVTGLVLKIIFDSISGGATIDLPLTWWLCALFVVAEVVRGFLMWLAWTYGVYWWDAAATIVRANLLRSVLVSPGAPSGRVPPSSGAAVARMRDDVANLVDFSDEFIALAGALVFAVGALIIMATIDWVVVIALVVPMIIVTILSTWASRIVRRRHAEAQERGAAVITFLAEAFNNILAIKAAGAEGAVRGRLTELNRSRQRAEVRSRLATNLLDAATGASVEFGIGLVLLLTAGSLRAGELTVGDIVLFTTYVNWLTGLPRSLSAMLVQAPQGEVATRRLTHLLAVDQGARDLVSDTTLWFDTRIPPPAPIPAAPPESFRELEVTGLTVRHPATGRIVVREVAFTVVRGSLTVITGAVGAGKTTVLRAVLGLVDREGGTVRWNEQEVSELGTFLVPPRVAYASQTPRLFSASVQENIQLGWSEEHLDRALHLAALTEDVAAMTDGMDTRTGPRGVRLSGGELQRTGVARAMARAPELLVVDDVSSALDVETESRLWQRLSAEAGSATQPLTVIAVSHRRAALAHATDIIVLDRGRVVGHGTLDHLLATCPELRRLWSEEAQLEAEE